MLPVRYLLAAVTLFTAAASAAHDSRLNFPLNKFQSPSAECKCFPGDDCWPSIEKWNDLNNTVDGNLIATVPLASPCHGSKYNETECATLRDEWLLSTVHCDPFQPENGSCTLGNYVKYSVEVRNPADIIATVRFAAQHNIRLVIRNTGHDYNGRSTGAGALAIWTHSLKDTEVIDWEDGVYDGKALRVGAGVAGYEALAAAHKAGLVVLTGECPSVGVAGGYAQGGGHSALSTVHGLAADNALSYDV
ncbi:hypothetical protein LLEC1_02897, partial [Akanthomyces lecanii]